MPTAPRISGTALTDPLQVPELPNVGAQVGQATARLGEQVSQTSLQLSAVAQNLAEKRARRQGSDAYVAAAAEANRFFETDILTRRGSEAYGTSDFYGAELVRIREKFEQDLDPLARDEFTRQFNPHAARKLEQSSRHEAQQDAAAEQITFKLQLDQVSANIAAQPDSPDAYRDEEQRVRDAYEINPNRVDPRLWKEAEDADVSRLVYRRGIELTAAIDPRTAVALLREFGSTGQGKLTPNDEQEVKNYLLDRVIAQDINEVVVTMLPVWENGARTSREVEQIIRARFGAEGDQRLKPALDAWRKATKARKAERDRYISEQDLLFVRDAQAIKANEGLDVVTKEAQIEHALSKIVNPKTRELARAKLDAGLALVTNEPRRQELFAMAVENPNEFAALELNEELMNLADTEARQDFSEMRDIQDRVRKGQGVDPPGFQKAMDRMITAGSISEKEMAQLTPQIRDLFDQALEAKRAAGDHSPLTEQQVDAIVSTGVLRSASQGTFVGVPEVVPLIGGFGFTWGASPRVAALGPEQFASRAELNRQNPRFAGWADGFRRKFPNATEDDVDTEFQLWIDAGMPRLTDPDWNDHADDRETRQSIRRAQREQDRLRRRGLAP